MKIKRIPDEEPKCITFVEDKLIICEAITSALTNKVRDGSRLDDLALAIGANFDNIIVDMLVENPDLDVDSIKEEKDTILNFAIECADFCLSNNIGKEKAKVENGHK